MKYKIIDGILHQKSWWDNKFEEMSIKELSKKVLELDNDLKIFKPKYKAIPKIRYCARCLRVHDRKTEIDLLRHKDCLGCQDYTIHGF